MSKPPIRVEIVAPVHNRKAITLQCLKSLSRINKQGLDAHIVIVDDGSTDGTSDAIRDQFPEVELIAGDGNLWFTEGTNVGVRRALERAPDYVLLSNDDQVFDSEFLQSMVNTAENTPRSVVGALLLLWDQPHKLFQVSPVWETWAGGWRHWYSQTVWTIPDGAWRVDLIVGNCLLVPAEAFRECGLMDSKRYPNFGDAEFTPRLKKHGWELLIDPHARVFCQPNTPPPKVGTMDARKRFNDLFLNRGSSHNLQRRLFANLDSAPSKLKGLAAFAAFLLHAAVGNGPETGSWAEKERPLREMFAESVVNGPAKT